MKTHYFSLGWGHVHKVVAANGKPIILDKDILVKITDDDPRARMFDNFDDVWCWEYEEFPAKDMRYFPRGVYDLNLGKSVAL